jgi:hypothetical protein
VPACLIGASTRSPSTDDDAISETTFAYDTLSRLTQETQELFEDNSRTMAYNYDQAGNRDEFQYDLSPTVTLAYEVGEGNRVRQFVKAVAAWHMALVRGSLSVRFLAGLPRAVARREHPASSFFLLTSHYSLFTRFLPPNARPRPTPQRSPRAFYS